ncbi:hypothetical protein SMC7_05940 [Candidatus Cryosericum terrychapinii]|uniref:DUF998 domain-containing protein n=2 Tax=Candidatus Cryosericum terrychapinii TaxID=2290919 RepID=A0A398CT08_9BACT|nr:hypothetical protein SMC7_05940 [Candidatus Cryosericum terrychapinii]
MSASRKGAWMNLKGLPLSSWSGALVLVLYLGLVMVSYSAYPSSFGPGNWLSDLGDKSLNPDGAVYYRLAPILAGLALMLFFVGLKDWHGGKRSKPRILMSIAQSFGVLGSFALIMTGWFSKDNPVPHLRWSIAGSYMCFGAVVLVGIALLCYTSVPKLFSIFCFLSAAVAITSATYRKAPWLEWLAVFMLMIFVASVSYLTHRHVNQGQ